MDTGNIIKTRTRALDEHAETLQDIARRLTREQDEGHEGSARDRAAAAGLIALDNELRRLLEPWRIVG